MSTALGQYTPESLNKVWSDVSSYLEPTKCTFLNIIPIQDTVSVSITCSRPCLITKTLACCEIFARVDLTTKKTVTNHMSLGLRPIVEAWSGDRSLLAKVFNHSPKQKPIYYIEIWSKNSILYEINLSDKGLHDKVYDEEIFSSMVWSDLNDKLYYLAETYKHSDDSFEFMEDFGEKLTSVFYPQIFCLDIKTQIVSKEINLPQHLFPSKLFYKNNKLYFLAYEFPHGKRGVIFCKNYPKSLFVVKDNGDIEKLTVSGKTVVSCVFNPDFPLIFIQERNIGGTHRCAVDLITINSCDYQRIVISENLFIDDFQENGWLNDNGSPGIIVNVISGLDNAMKLLAFRNINDCWRVYDVDTSPNFNYKLLSTSLYKSEQTAHLCVCSKSSLVSPWALIILKIKFVLDHQSRDIVIIEEIEVFSQEMRKKLPQSFKSFCFDANRKIVQKENCMFTSMLVLPINFNSEKSTIIVMSHGGPHSLRNKEYTRACDYLLQVGFILYIVNYRGSTGFDDKTLKSLTGNIGKQEVDDVHLSLLSVCDHEKITSKNIVCFGGSHGGFISTHLLCQYADTYLAGIIYNPVINLIDMFTSSDVPEWVIAEAGLPETSICKLNIEYYSQLYQKSPIYHADKIKSPVLIFLGNEDKIVAPHQGLQLYRLLKSKNHDVRVFIYNDGHNLLSVEAQTSLFYEMVCFLQRVIIEYP